MILVVGATGSLGGRIVRMLLERGEAVRALTRSSNNAAPLRDAGAEVVVGDLKDLASLERACQDADVVIATASASKTGDDSIENVDLHGNQNLIDAAERAGVRHFIFVSTVGASAEHPVPLFRAKAAAEERLKAGRMTYTILQPNAFMDVWFPMLVEMPALSGRPVTLVGEAKRRHSFVAERDVAAFAVAAVHNPAARNTTIVIGGPEPVTLRDVVRAYEDAAGQTFTIRSVSPGESIPGLPPAVSGIAAALETYDTPIPMDETARRYGVELIGVRELARARIATT
ncbi:MAG TPA: SDR family oxidoreductase [Gemmatimonadaceae bacterium]|nr:SDR family oxidoreductase [Gemmatimonadaceae bacterium]